MNKNPSRRDFLSGSAILGPIRRRAASIAPRDYVHFTRRAMACDFSVFFPADTGGEVAARRSIAALGALDLIDELENQMTVYRKESEVSQLNGSAFANDTVVESRLFDLLVRAKSLWKATGGAFDITAGPLSKIWGFHQREPRVPGKTEIKEALSQVGCDKLQLDEPSGSVRYQIEGLEINLGAIGKGYALDRCAESLSQSGEETFFIHGGKSSVLAKSSPSSAPWQIDLRLPSEEKPILASFCLTDHAMATSGDAVQRITVEGKTYGHIIDPRTGSPASGVITASAFAPTAAEADALATAFYLMGPELTAEYCQRESGVGAIMVLEPKNAAVTSSSDASVVVEFGSLPEKI